MSAEAAPLTAARQKRGRWAIVGGVIVLVIIVAIVAAMTLMRPQSSATSNLSTATAAKRTIDVTVSGTGSAVAADSVTVNPQISGTVEKLYVSLGETVTAGQTLYTISSDSVQTQRLQAKASLLQSEQSVTNAESSVQQAENQLYSAKTQVLQAENNLKKAQSQPTTSTDYAYNVKIAKRQVASADDAVDSAETGVDSAEIGLEAAQASYKTAKENYSTAVKNTEQTVVVAPSDGVTTALPLSVGSAVSAGTNSSSSSSSGSSSGSSGGASAGGSSSSGTSSSSSSSSSSSGSSITISNMDSLQVELTVSEVDIPKVAVGQRADVTFDAISGKTFTGSVKSILPNATTSSGVVNYTVYIKLDKLDTAMRTGMTATVDIKTLTASNVVAVPTAAIKTDSASNSKYVIAVDQSGQTAQQKVTAGVSDDTYTQIVSGVNAGTTVVTGSTTSSSSSSSSSGSSSSSSGRSGGGLMMGAGGPPSGGGPGGN